ncbi:putative bifunctional diguanylate cyclase/phosphodiesterase [Devosia sp.]|uniref:putative bifunctional diguanylate cyclase/phosphodiesterase n=1 Tax=Devosia sp. TaxID=1871048 RepID=UPI003A8D3B06
MARSDTELTAEDALLDAALHSIPYGFCVWSPEFRLVMWNQHYLDIYHFPASRIFKGMTLEAVVQLSSDLGNHPDQSPGEFLAAYQHDLLAHRTGSRAKTRERVEGGRTLETAWAYSEGLGWVVTHEDVTDEIAEDELTQQRKRELELQNMRLDATVNNISQGIGMYDAKGCLVLWNKPYQRIYNLPAHLLMPGTNIHDVLNHLFDGGMRAGKNRDDYLRMRREIISRGEYGKYIHEFGGRAILMQHHPMPDGGWVTTHEDITEQRQHEERIRHLARHDGLTQLPNRMQFLEEMAATEADIGRGDGLAVLCIDLDDFKSVNDTLGHALGDKVLQQTSARLWGTSHENDLLARLGGDEFALMMRGVGSPAEAARTAERITKVMSEPFAIEGNQIVVGASVGIAMAPQDGTTTEALMKNADLALYRAKKEGRSVFKFFEVGMDEAIQKRRTLEAGLRGALARSEFELAYQPLLGLEHNRITCFEALLRWQTKDGTVPPAEFIPVAEDTGLIVPIGEWVLREACRTAATWPADVRVAVNLSAVQFKNNHLFELVQSALHDAGLDPLRLELEITESLLLADSAQTLKTLHRLRALGIRISMDDFGTGYSSLSYLRSFPFDKIKIDRSFMRDLTTKSDSLAIIKAVIGLGQSLGMTTTAEGIETEAQLDVVRRHGCDEVQGFLFSPPISADAVGNMLKTPLRPALTNRLAS